MKRLMVLLCAMLLVCGITGSAIAAPVYLSGVTASTGWLDVEQAANSNWCWAAAASNMLAYSSWEGPSPALDSNTEMFSYFQNHWTNVPGSSYYAIQWFFDGTNGSNGWSGWSQVTTPGGDYYSLADFTNNNGYGDNESQAWNWIQSDVNSDRVFSMLLGDATGGIHWLTGWGYDLSSGMQVFVTDSLDGLANNATWYSLSEALGGSYYYLPGYNGWRILAMDSLGYNVANVQPTGTGDGTVPEPTTMILLGTGLSGLLVRYRKRR